MATRRCYSVGLAKPTAATHHGWERMRAMYGELRRPVADVSPGSLKFLVSSRRSPRRYRSPAPRIRNRTRTRLCVPIRRPDYPVRSNASCRGPPSSTDLVVKRASPPSCMGARGVVRARARRRASGVIMTGSGGCRVESPCCARADASCPSQTASWRTPLPAGRSVRRGEPAPTSQASPSKRSACELEASVTAPSIDMRRGRDRD